MCAAHFEALLAVLRESSGQELGFKLASDVLHSMHLLTSWGADALLTDPRLQSAVATCLASIPQASGVAASRGHAQIARHLSVECYVTAHWCLSRMPLLPLPHAAICAAVLC